MITIKTQKYLQHNSLKKHSSFGDMAKDLGQVGKDLLSGAKGVASKAIGKAGDFLNNPITEKLLGGTSTYEGVRGLTDVTENIGGSKLISIKESNEINQLSSQFKKDMFTEIQNANDFQDLSIFTRKLYCRYARELQIISGAITSPNHPSFQKIMNVFKKENQYFNRKYLEIFKDTGGTSLLSPSEKGLKIIKQINDKFYAWLPHAMEIINSKFSVKNGAEINAMILNNCVEE